MSRKCLLDCSANGAKWADDVHPGKVALELIAVQSGSYLGEDDIVRFADEYGRVK